MEAKKTILTVLLTVGGALSSVAFAYSGGSGTPTDPYQIAMKTDLLQLAADTNDYNKCFILTADVNMEEQVWTKAIIAEDTSIGSGFQGTAFTGQFDGNGHKITNFTINGGWNDFLGLFGCIDSGSSVKNLGLESFAVSGHYYVGGLAGYNYYGSISNCYSTGSASGFRRVGGLVGCNEGGSISNCYATSEVSGHQDSGSVGGLVGNNYGSISDCYATGAVSYSSSDYIDRTGGLVGVNTGSINNCYATGAVSGLVIAGGLVGFNSGSISNCYSTGVVLTSSEWASAGGLVGDNYEEGAIISNCYATGDVNGGAYAGGLVATNYKGAISYCYSIGAVSGSSSVGGLVGENYDCNSVISAFWDVNTSGQTESAGGEGKTTAEMKTLSTFVSAGWDFVEVWGIGNGQTYTYLKHFNGFNPADLNYSGTVDFVDFAILAANWLEGAGF